MAMLSGLFFNIIRDNILYSTITMSEDRLIQKLIELEDNIVFRVKKELSDEFVTKKDFFDFKDKVFNNFDYIISILKKLDEECIINTGWIEKIKQKLNIY